MQESCCVRAVNSSALCFSLSTSPDYSYTQLKKHGIEGCLSRASGVRMWRRAAARGKTVALDSQPWRGERYKEVDEVLCPFRGWHLDAILATGLRPWLHSYAAPRLGCCDIKSFHAFLKRRL